MSYFFKSLALALMLTPATMNFAAAQTADPAGGTMIISVSQNRELTGMIICLLYTSPSPRDATLSRMPSSA